MSRRVLSTVWQVLILTDTVLDIDEKGQISKCLNLKILSKIYPWRLSSDQHDKDSATPTPLRRTRLSGCDSALRQGCRFHICVWISDLNTKIAKFSII